MSEQNSHRYAFDGQADLPSYSEAVPRRMCGRYAESSTMQASTDSNQPQAQYLPNYFDPENGSTCMTEGCSGTDTAVGGVPQLVFVRRIPQIIFCVLNIRVSTGRWAH